MKTQEFKTEFTFTGIVKVRSEKGTNEANIIQQLQNNFGFVASDISGGTYLSTEKDEEGIIDWDIDLHPTEKIYYSESWIEADIPGIDLLFKYNDERNTLPSCEAEYILERINKGYVEGELCYIDFEDDHTTDKEILGMWKIK